MLPLAFAGILAGSLSLLAGISGHSYPEVIKGETKPFIALVKGSSNPAVTGGPQLPEPSLTATQMRGAYANPIPHSATLGRTDQGVDFSAKPGTPLSAVGKAKILGIQQNWYKGQPFLYYQLLEGPMKGRVVYIAEQITPTVKPGDIVQAGQTIATTASSGTGIETGFGTKSGQTLAQGTTGYKEGQVTQAGLSFKKFIESFATTSTKKKKPKPKRKAKK